MSDRIMSEASGQTLAIRILQNLSNIETVAQAVLILQQAGYVTQDDLAPYDEKIDNLQFQVDGLGEPFRLQDFNQSISVTIPTVSADVANTSIPNVDIDLDTIDPTGGLNNDFAIAGLVKYEVYDSSNARINAFQVCSFSMNSQRTLRVRMMCAGTSSKVAKKIQGAILLKHR